MERELLSDHNYRSVLLEALGQFIFRCDDDTDVSIAWELGERMGLRPDELRIAVQEAEFAFADDDSEEG